MTPWRTAIATSDETGLWIRGYDVKDLMKRATFTDLVFVLHQGRMPTAKERGLLDAILVSVADHGAGAPSCAAARLVASGNRESLSAAVAAGLLAVGDDHGGAGTMCMEMLAKGVADASREGLSVEQVAAKILKSTAAEKRRVPGLGHRVHTKDPRVDVLFEMARDAGLKGDAIALLRAIESALEANGKKVPINVDGALAAVLHEMGFAPSAGKFIFMIGRVAGLTAEVAEEYAREKPMRIRFDVAYDGVPPRAIETPKE
jgi:citrate synthase